ncbi:MAG: hypothetical protein MJ070_07520 [Lachnospiraceae bacterium]|nr:hypothetical protein [Lachnospiraceae bacterium]
MKASRLLALLLALLTVVGVLAACAETKDPGNETVPPKESDAEETRVTHDLPPMTFDGYTFGMLHWYIDGWEVHGIDLYAEEQSGDPIEDAAFVRNSRLSDSLKIEFEYMESPHDEVVNLIRQSVRSGDDFYDIYYARLTDVYSVLLEGAFLDYNYDLPYINLDKPYWDQSVREQLSFGDHLFMEASALNITDKNATDSILFNKALARDYNLPDLYTIVKQGNWTIDALFENMTAFDGDMNGDGKLDYENDVMGYLGKDDVLMSLFYGGEGHLTVKDEFDLPVYDFNTEENIDLLNEIFDLMYDPAFANGHVVNVEFNDAFIAGHGLFFWSRLEGVVRMRGEESIDFGILPTPKRDEAQTEYMSMLSEHMTGLPSVLSTETAPETVSYILEAMAAASYYDLQTAYYDVTLKTKAARDDESQEMLDIIFKHRILDLGELCLFGEFSNTLLRWPSVKGNYNIVSAYESAESKIQVDIEKFIAAVDKIDEQRSL